MAKRNKERQYVERMLGLPPKVLFSNPRGMTWVALEEFLSLLLLNILGFSFSIQ